MNEYVTTIVMNERGARKGCALMNESIAIKG